jgi:hypothetical protein
VSWRNEHRDGIERFDDHERVAVAVATKLDEVSIDPTIRGVREVPNLHPRSIRVGEIPPLLDATGRKLAVDQGTDKVFAELCEGVAI